jgi:hypothetical protein
MPPTQRRSGPFPDGPIEQEGVKAGEAAAAAMLDDRQGDGFLAPFAPWSAPTLATGGATGFEPATFGVIGRRARGRTHPRDPLSTERGSRSRPLGQRNRPLSREFPNRIVSPVGCGRVGRRRETSRCVVRTRNVSVLCPRVLYADNTKCRFTGTLYKPSGGLEPSTPSLPWNASGNRSQPTATVFGCLSRFRRIHICHRLPPVATAGLHKGSILRCLIGLLAVSRRRASSARWPNQKTKNDSSDPRRAPTVDP